MSSRTSSRSTLTMVPSTMSPSLKYLIVWSMAARKSSSDPMSLMATCGVVEAVDGGGVGGHVVGCSGSGCSAGAVLVRTGCDVVLSPCDLVDVRKHAVIFRCDRGARQDDRLRAGATLTTVRRRCYAARSGRGNAPRLRAGRTDDVASRARSPASARGGAGTMTRWTRATRAPSSGSVRPAVARRPSAPPSRSGRASALVGRRRRRLPRRARRRHRRRRLRLVPGGPARARRAACSATSPGAGCWRSAAARRRARAGSRPRAPGRWRSTSRPGMLRHAARARRRDRASLFPLVQAGRRAAALRRRRLRPGLLGVRRGAVRGRPGAGDARGRPGAAAGRPVGVRGEPPDALDVPRRPGPGRADRRSSRTSTGRPTSRSTPQASPTYVEHHRTLGDRVRDVVAAGLGARRPRRARVAGGPRDRVGAVVAAARRAVPRHGDLRLPPPVTTPWAGPRPR